MVLLNIWSLKTGYVQFSCETEDHLMAYQVIATLMETVGLEGLEKLCLGGER